MNIRNAFIVATSLCLLSACEKIDLEKEEGGNDGVVHTVPTRTGEGTQEAPYTVGQVLYGETPIAQEAWVIGYLVGSTYRTMANAIYAAQTTYSGNILLSYDSLCNSADKCIAVELTSKTMQERLSLASDSTRFRKCVVVNGTLGRYFTRLGLREAITGYLLPNTDLQIIDPQPTEWDETEEKY